MENKIIYSWDWIYTKEAQEEIERVKKEKERKEKEESKKLIKGERKRLRNFAKEHNYFTSDETEKVSNMAEVEKICEVYSYEQIKELNSKLETNSSKAKDIFLSALKKFNDKLEEERMEAAQMTSKSTEGGKSKSNVEWNTEELQLLIKSVNLFPAGTVNRWKQGYMLKYPRDCITVYVRRQLRCSHVLKYNHKTSQTSVN